MTTWTYKIYSNVPSNAWICEVKRPGDLPEITAWRHEKDAKRYIRERIGVDRVTWNLVDTPNHKYGKREVE